MSTPKRSPGRKRPGRSTFTTKSGNTIKLNQSLSDRFRANRAAKARKRATYMGSLPSGRFQRILYRLQPKRVFHYWFSREGGIMALKISGLGIVVGFVLLVGLFAYFRKDLPQIKDISGDNIGGSIIYYDRTGQTVLWQDYNAVKRIPVKSNQISPYIKQATVAVEDKDFYHEGAFNVRGILRAGIHDVTGGGGTVQGGSTITQQLVKLNEEWTADRSISRKVKELILAVDLEREYSKDDILTGYLNIAPYGNVQYGVQSASQDYFGIDAKDLTLSQAAFLAAIPQAPGYYSPYNSPTYNPSTTEDNFGRSALLGRQHYVLDQMVKQGYITQQQASEAKKVDILAQVHQFQQHYSGIKAPYFVLAAKNQLEQKYGAETVKRGGWKVITTLDLALQTTAETLVANNLANVKGGHGDQEATVAEDVKTGQIAALVGGVDFNNPDYGQINYAQTDIPPGSSFKPYDYTAMINNTTNTGAGSVLYDIQQPILDSQGNGYKCTIKTQPKFDKNANCLWDYDLQYPGPITVRYALGGSRNIPAVKAMLTAGVDKTIKTANALMGTTNGYNCYLDEQLTKRGPCYASSAIGDGAYLHLDNHVNGVASLGRLGVSIPTTYIMKITDSAGKDVYTWTQPKGTQVVRPDAAYIIDDILSDPNASYLPASYKFQHYKGWKFAVKTGTTNDNFDGLMASWSTQYAVVSWVGYHDRTKAMTKSMEIMTEPLTRGLMEAAHDKLATKPVNWTPPAGIKTLPAYVVTHKVSRLGEVIPSPSTDIFPSWYQQKQGNTSQTIDTVSGKLATSCTPEAAKKVQGGANANIFSADIFMGASGGTTVTANDDVHNCTDAKPSVTLTAPSTCSVGSACTFTVTVSQGTHPLSSAQYPGTVNLYVNDQKVQTQNVSDSPSTVTFTYTPTAAGAATIKAEIIDSVLYNATNEASISFSNPTVTQNTTGDSGQGLVARATQRRSRLLGND